MNKMYDGIEHYTYRKTYTEDETNEMRVDFIDSVLQQRKIAEEIKRLTAEKKVLTDANSTLLDQIVSGGIVVSNDCGFLDDYDERSRTYFDENGEVVGTRKLRSTEIQNVSMFSKVINGG